MAQKRGSSLGESLKSTFAAIVIPLEIVIAVLIYLYVLGNPANFEGGDPNNHPLPGNWLGIIYKGRIVVAGLIALLMITLTFGIERLITISSATGRGSIKRVVTKIRSLVSAGNITQAIQLAIATDTDNTGGSARAALPRLARTGLIGSRMSAARSSCSS